MVDPNDALNSFVAISNGHLDTTNDLTNLNDTEWTCIQSLTSLVNDEITLSLSIEDFKEYFKSKQERMASSSSGRHMGHYKVALECVWWEENLLPETILSISHQSLITATPLRRWYNASQVMIEKGKGSFVKNLRIIQLCEADLNFTLHTIWGHCLIRQALKYSTLESLPYTTGIEIFHPGQCPIHPSWSNMKQCCFEQGSILWFIPPNPGTRHTNWLWCHFCFWPSSCNSFNCDQLSCRSSSDSWDLHVQLIKGNVFQFNHWFWQICLII